ncbi:pentapeptide repeat-containing protein [Streptomyces sp. GbtcB6]|uniref:pentapeptide repeat-containing protein n=1 Tax=Streptomyces sp. GbtcB6 TaxID=2824751 RepID=UPI0020C63B13|nr:pentapeptide repeat-containing protein [Streptomyces sp. GbtcB6]
MNWWVRLERSLGLLATMATLAVAAFAWVSIKQVGHEQAITQEGQITDRYNVAVGNLGADSEDVRLGGIYALQRIMQDSPRDQHTVIDILSAYIRAHAPKPKKGAPVPGRLTRDAAAALSVLCVRDGQHDGTAVVDLEGTYLPHVDLSGADLRGANLSHTDLRDATLNHADLSGADLSQARLSDIGADHLVMRRANLFRAVLRNVSVSQVDLSDASLMAADLRDAYLDGADLRRANLLGTDLRGAFLPDADLRQAEVFGDLRGAYLGGADLRNASMNKADLRDATLGSADLSGADTTEADLRGADLTRASMGGLTTDIPDRITKITVQQLLFARIDAATRLPARLASDPRVKKAMAGPTQAHPSAHG